MTQTACPCNRFSNNSKSWQGRTHCKSLNEEALGLDFSDAKGPLCRPRRIIIMRHGESAGNKDETAYVHCPDWRIPLTEQGWADSRDAGEKIKEIIQDNPLVIYTSPYIRTKQTLAGMIGSFETNEIVAVREEPRLTEQQFGNFQNVVTIREAKDERHRFGRFYYRFPQGESGLDVYNRAASFIASMFRDFANSPVDTQNLNILIITHGLTLRLLVMRWFQYSISDFEDSKNPPNGGFVVMERITDEKGKQWYKLTDDSLDLIQFKEQTNYGSLWKVLEGVPRQHE